jgi:hypothetical protein
MSVTTSSSTPFCRQLSAIMTRWQRLFKIVRDPYRPELHYMRGRGPKWHARHQARTESGAF